MIQPNEYVNYKFDVSDLRQGLTIYFDTDNPDVKADLYQKKHQHKYLLTLNYYKFGVYIKKS